MRKFFVLWLSCLWMMVFWVGCVDVRQEKTEITVFAAASLQETLTELAEQYMMEHENVRIMLTFDSSGTLKTQIQEGAQCDIFISAGQKQMDQLDITADPQINTEGLDFVLQGSRFDILENKVALVVPEGNPAEILSYGDLAAALRAGGVMLAMGSANVPVGQYSQKILTCYQIDEGLLAAAGCISYGSDVKEVAAQVAEAVVDCGIVYQTDACSAGLTVVDVATEEMCGRVVYPAAVLNISGVPEEAGAFLAFLTENAADAIFQEVGFSPIGE